MYIELNNLDQKYGTSITGLIQVGANNGQETQHYVEDCGIEKLVLFEPLPEAFNNLLRVVEPFQQKCHIEAHNVALGSEKQTSKIYIADNEGQSSSLLKPTLHLEEHSNVLFEKEITVSVERLDDMDIDPSSINALSIDVQGYELEVLKGARQFLKNGIDYIVSEVSREPLYDQSAVIEEIDAFLDEAGFRRMHTVWATDFWGDALYVRRDIIPADAQSIVHQIPKRKRRNLFQRLARSIRKRLPTS